MGEHLASLGLNVMRILHGEEEYEYLAPIYPGDVLTGIVTVVEGKSRQSRGFSMDIVTLETRYTNQDSVEVLRARQTVVVRE
jgi:acyl dehydratase